MRFQAAPALADVEGSGSAAALVGALRHETHPEVAASIVESLGRFDPPTADVAEALSDMLRDGADRLTVEVGYHAARIMAGAGRTEGVGYLIDALDQMELRDGALEALATLGPRTPDLALSTIRNIARTWRTPAVTRVRAAYALARMVPSEGEPMLERLARSPRPAVREAVRDARTAMAVLAERER